MWLPFRKELEDAFRSDGSLWLKAAGAGFVTLFVVLTGLARDDEMSKMLTLPIAGMVAVCSFALGACLALALSLKDGLKRRVARGEHVNLLLRLYLASGIWSLLLWFVSVIVGVFFITIAVFA